MVQPNLYLSSKKGEVTLAGPSQFVLDTVTTRYRSIIANTLSELTGEEIAVEFVVSDKERKPSGRWTAMKPLKKLEKRKSR